MRLFSLIRTALCNARGRDPEIDMLGFGERLIYGLVRDGEVGFMPFTMLAEREHVVLHADCADATWQYAASAIAYRTAEIESGGHSDPHAT